VIQEKTTSIHKTFTAAFVLDKPKLSRIFDILEQRYKERNTPFNPEIEVTFTNGRKLKTPSLEKLFLQDNTIKNPIKSLSIRDTEIQPDKLGATLLYTSKDKYNIELIVLSGDSKYASQVFAELEEQVDRTFSRGWLYKITAVQVIFMIMTLVFIGALYVILTSASQSVEKGSGYMLSLAEMDNFNSRAKTITSREDKVDWLFELNQRQLENSLRIQRSERIQVGNPFTLRRVFIALPILLAFVSFFILFARYYPQAVFLWGDIEEHYTKLMSTRKMIWTVVILALVMGIITNLFSLGIAPSIQ
jgi:hypothetical protein